MKNTKEWFVDGVMAFTIKDLLKEDPEKVATFSGTGGKFSMTIKEILNWQASYKCYYAEDVYKGEEGLKLLRTSLKGGSKEGEEAWKMKFAIRISLNPIFLCFDGQTINREPGDKLEDNIYLVSVCGHDFAGRRHDVMDTTKYITNWKKVYKLKDGLLYAKGRDFIPTGEEAKLDKDLLNSDLIKMARLRLRAQDKLGIQIAGETGIGLGVFSGDYIGIGAQVRNQAALALCTVLQQEKFENIKAVVCALPIFRKVDNYHYFCKVFSQNYKGDLPVYIIDQDMHQLARCAARYFKTSELNPADSHGVFGEYWQNRGPGTEEKLALTTAGLLTQHHAVNPEVTKLESYIPLDVSK